MPACAVVRRCDRARCWPGRALPVPRRAGRWRPSRAACRSGSRWFVGGARRAGPIAGRASRRLCSAPLYIGVPLGACSSRAALAGRTRTLLLIATVVVSDSAQYYTGRAFGRRPLAPAISPKKTVEGAIGGLVFGTLFMAVAGRRRLPARPGAVARAAAALRLVVLGICGDLFESRLKRARGRERQLGADSRARRRARSDRRAAVCRARLFYL